MHSTLKHKKQYVFIDLIGFLDFILFINQPELIPAQVGKLVKLE